MGTKDLKVALAGNPNCGKTTIFNNITGARQHVGNYPGVTVEKREGFRRFQDKGLLVVDVPGTYSLTAHALDELVARNVIINDQPDIIVNILDASNLERNLYLAIQLLELERPVVLALNMTDVAEKAGQKINDEVLRRKLGTLVVRTVGNRNRGTDALLKAVLVTADEGEQLPFTLDYGAEIELRIKQVSSALTGLTEIKYPLRWLAIKLLENDQEVHETVSVVSGGDKVLELVRVARKELQQAFGEEPEIVIAERRYSFAGEVFREIVGTQNDFPQTTSDKIDRILTHRILGLPIFLVIMLLLFSLVVTLGQPLTTWVQDGVDWLGTWVGQHMADGDTESLVKDGIIHGVGTVLSFLPQIFLLFLGVSLLEDTGYMARAAFVMDRAMRAVGLHGKSFIPLLLGFGCNISSIMGTRTLENPRDRMVTILVAPLMSCSARLPIYTLLVAAFFSARYAGVVLFSLYTLGILLAVVMAFVFRKFLFPGTTEPFTMEMPLYHIPTFRSIVTHMWERSFLYVKKAGTIILAVTILVWVALHYPSNVPYSKDFDQLKAAADTAYTAQVTEKVLAPLKLQKVEDNAQLQALITQIAQIKSEKGDQKETANAPADNTAGTAKAPDNPKLTALQQESPKLYPYAIAYSNLSDDHKDATDKLDNEQAGEKMASSYAGKLGHFIEPLLKPLGFDWKMGISLFAGFLAKEGVVGTMGTVYSVGEPHDDNTQALQDSMKGDHAFTPLIAYVFMVFSLLYTPCVAAMAVIQRETNSWKWPAFTIVYSIGLAWIVSFGVYRAGLLLGY